MPDNNLRIVFAGTPDFAAAHLSSLISEGFQIVSAYSQPDRPAGRGKKLLPTPVKSIAMQHGIDVRQPLHFSAEDIQVLQESAPDVMVVVAYGLLLPREVLELPRFGCINVHASLLPRWRGAAPIERAIMAGDRESGVSIMQMDQGLDTGPVLATSRVAILGNDNSQTLGEKICTAGCQALSSSLRQLPDLLNRAQAQDEALACYAKKIRKEESHLDFSQDAGSLHNLIRALYPRSPAWCMHQGKRLRFLESSVTDDKVDTAVPGTILSCGQGYVDIACGVGVLRIHRVQPEGKSAMDITSLLNGRPDFFIAGMLLGAD